MTLWRDTSAEPPSPAPCSHALKQPPRWAETNFNLFLVTRGDTDVSGQQAGEPVCACKLLLAMHGNNPALACCHAWRAIVLVLPGPHAPPHAHTPACPQTVPGFDLHTWRLRITEKVASAACGGKASPTLSPTLSPTPLPTQSPTLQPTPSPTLSPTLTPTSNSPRGGPRPILICSL